MSSASGRGRGRRGSRRPGRLPGSHIWDLCAPGRARHALPCATALPRRPCAATRPAPRAAARLCPAAPRSDACAARPLHRTVKMLEPRRRRAPEPGTVPEGGKAAHQTGPRRDRVPAATPAPCPCLGRGARRAPERLVRLPLPQRLTGFLSPATAHAARGSGERPAGPCAPGVPGLRLAERRPPNAATASPPRWRPGRLRARQSL